MCFKLGCLLLVAEIGGMMESPSCQRKDLNKLGIRDKDIRGPDEFKTEEPQSFCCISEICGTVF